MIIKTSQPLDTRLTKAERIQRVERKRIRESERENQREIRERDREIFRERVMREFEKEMELSRD